MCGRSVEPSTLTGTRMKVSCFTQGQRQREPERPWNVLYLPSATDRLVLVTESVWKYHRPRPVGPIESPRHILIRLPLGPLRRLSPHREDARGRDDAQYMSRYHRDAYGRDPDGPNYSAAGYGDGPQDPPPPPDEHLYDTPQRFADGSTMPPRRSPPRVGAAEVSPGPSPAPSPVQRGVHPRDPSVDGSRHLSSESSSALSRPSLAAAKAANVALDDRQRRRRSARDLMRTQAGKIDPSKSFDSVSGYSSRSGGGAYTTGIVPRPKAAALVTPPGARDLAKSRLRFRSARDRATATVADSAQASAGGFSVTAALGGAPPAAATPVTPTSSHQSTSSAGGSRFNDAALEEASAMSDGPERATHAPQHSGGYGSPAGSISSGEGPRATIVRLRRELDNALADNDRSRAALERNITTVRELKEEIRTTTEARDASDVERLELRDRVADLEADLRSMRDKMGDALRDSSRNAAELISLKDEAAEANRRDAALAELRRQLEAAEAELAASDQRSRQIEEGVRREREDWEMTLARKEDELDRVRSEMSGVVTESKDVEELWSQRAHTREERIRELKDEVAKAADDLATARRREEKLQADRDKDRKALGEIAELRLDLDEAAKVLDETRGALNDALDELASVKKERDRVEVDRDFIRDELEVVKAKLKQEGEETDRLLMERNTLRDENLGMRTRQSQAADRRLAEREAKIGELSVKLSNATEESKGLRSRLEMSERQGSDEFESKNSRLEKRIAIVEADRDELKRCLDGAMAELEIADAESKDAYDSKLHFSELEKKAADLDVLLSERNDEIARLRTQVSSLEANIELQKLSTPIRGERGSTTSSASSVRARRNASETKLRSMMKIIGKSSSSVAESSVSHALSFEDDVKALSAYSPNSRGMDEIKTELRHTQKALEATVAELESLQQAHSRSTRGSNSTSFVSELGKEREKSLEKQLMRTKGDLEAKEAASNDLRNSLKEAVALLTPLKEQVAQSERQKRGLESELNDARTRISLWETGALRGEGSSSGNAKLMKTLKGKEEQINRLEAELSEVRPGGSTSPRSGRRAHASDQYSNEEADRLRRKLQSSQEELKARKETEYELARIVDDYRRQLEFLQKEHEALIAKKDDLERQLMNKPGNVAESDDIHHLKGTIIDNIGEMKAKDEEIARLQLVLRRRAGGNDQVGGGTEVERKLNESMQIEADLKAELDVAVAELKSKDEKERSLNRSLSEAVNILKPLQQHVETAEMEKESLLRELAAAQERNGTFAGDAGAEDLRNELLDLQRKHEATKKLLDEAANTNASLLNDLTEMEQEEEGAQLQIADLQERLRSAEEELERANQSSTSANSSRFLPSLQDEPVYHQPSQVGGQSSGARIFPNQNW